MTPQPRVSRLIGLSVGQRLLLGIAPALLAVVLVLGLAYYGEIGRQAPGYVVTGAGILACLSLYATWSNTRYLAARIRRLAGGVDQGSTDVAVREDDELGRIEQVVGRLGTALAESEAERRRALVLNEAHQREQATMLAATVRDTMTRLDDIRLPLHILIDAPFGELNENQEELIETARSAADALDAALRRLTTICDVDRGAISVLLERVSVNEVIRGVIPMLRASAERRNLHLDVTLDPSMPKVAADRARLAEALALLGSEAAWTAREGAEPHISTGARESYVWVAMSPLDSTTNPGKPEHVVATRLITVQGGTVITEGERLEIRLPTKRPERA
ncbi:MAG: hypothetical protein H7099_04395 [Gemmatimonadaceae bacterium]|nr:hypothetical protein [Gemmatimonadaceae bacterium]